jgi:predicted permease
MAVLRRLTGGFRALFQKRKLDAEMDEEISSHIDMRTLANIESGMSAEEARRTALRQFGWKETIKEECREGRGVMWLENLVQDVRFGARMLLKNPGFTAVAIITLALGIGANMVIFTLINALLFKPVMANKPQELVSVYQFDTLPGGERHWQWFSYPDFVELRTGNDVFSELAAVDEGTVGIQEGDLTQARPVRYVSANYLKMFGIAPIMGREMTLEEEASGAAVAVLSYGFWKTLGEDPGIIGRTLKLARGEVVVIGVMPPGFTGDKLLSPAMFLPIGLRETFQINTGQTGAQRLNDRANRWLSVEGRLKQGLGFGAAQHALAALSARFPHAETDKLPRTLVCDALDRFDYHPTRSDFGRVAAPAVALSLGLSLLVLLAACLNLANMMLARGAARRKEIAVRMALGAARRRVLRQLFTEGLLLAAVGGGVSLLLSFSALQFYTNFLPSELSQALVRFNQPGDWRLLAALTLFSGLAAVFFAFGPALKLSRLDFNEDLKRHGTDDPVKPGAQHLFAIGQLALSMVLLVAAGLFTRSAMNVFRANPGFEFGDNFYLQINSQLVGASESQTRELARLAT